MQPLFPKSIDTIIATVAGLLITSAQLILIRDVWRKKINPSLLTWLGWGLIMGTGLLAQILEDGWQSSLTGLALSTAGCLCIFTIALLRNTFLYQRSDIKYLVLGLLCLIIYISSHNAIITTLFAILADFIAGIPTLIAGYRNPKSQKTIAWTLGAVSWAFTISVCFGHAWLYAWFPIYLFLYNLTLYIFTHRSTNAGKSI